MRRLETAPPPNAGCIRGCPALTSAMGRRCKASVCYSLGGGLGTAQKSSRRNRCNTAPLCTNCIQGERESPPHVQSLSELLSSWQRNQGNGCIVRTVDRREVKTVSTLLAKAFYKPGAIKPLNGVAYSLFKAEVLDAMHAKLRYYPIDRFACLVAESMDGVDGEAREILGAVEVSVQSEEKILRVLPHLQSYAYISSMAVGVETRRRGIGSTLLAAAELVAELWGEREVTLYVHSDNTAARELYKRQGYQEVSEDRSLIPLFGAPNRILMRKRLP